MHLTKQILALMLDGQERTASELTALTGREHKQVKNSVHNGRRLGYYTVTGEHYTITDFGRKWAVHEYLTHEEKARRNHERMKAARAKARGNKAPRAIKPKPIDIPVTQEVIVLSAMKSRPALDMAWMSVAREQEATHV